MRIYILFGSGVGTSVILSINTEKVLGEFGIEAEVHAVALPQLSSQPPCQLILATKDVAAELTGRVSEVVALRSALDLAELKTALIHALG
ncbi:MAG: PTS sugar transporter subunit IIB [Aquiluna sp.]